MLGVQVDDKEWIDAVVIGEDIVQREDMHMCDLVQGGLASPAYDVGRWVANQGTSLLHSYTPQRVGHLDFWPASGHVMAVWIVAACVRLLVHML